MRLPSASLEDWLREYYFTAPIDLGSSGVYPWSMAELRALTGLAAGDLDAVVFRDSDSFGGPAVRKAVADRCGAGAPDRVMVTHGSTEAIFLVMTALLAPGDEIVVVDPCYHALDAVAAAIGCEVRRWPLRPERDWRPDVDDLRAAVTPRTRMVVANFPHNPTGATLTAAQVGEVVDVCAGIGAYLFWDGAFADLVYDAPPLPDPVGAYERCVSTGTLSKAYGLPGLRFGWCVAAPEVLVALLPMRDRLTLCLSPLVETVACRAVERADELLAPRLRVATANRARLAAWAAERPDRIELSVPPGGVTAFPRLRVADVDGFCRRLAEEHGVMVVPGSAFGHPWRIRLGFGGDGDEFVEGLSRLATALDAAA